MSLTLPDFLLSMTLVVLWLLAYRLWARTRRDRGPYIDPDTMVVRPTAHDGGPWNGKVSEADWVRSIRHGAENLPESLAHGPRGKAWVRGAEPDSPLSFPEEDGSHSP